MFYGMYDYHDEEYETKLAMQAPNATVGILNKPMCCGNNGRNDDKQAE